MLQFLKPMVYILVSLMIWFPGNIQQELLAQEDPGWPREFLVEGARIVMHQPQVDSWKSYRRIEAWAAVEITPKGVEDESIGSIKFVAETKTNFETRTVLVHNIGSRSRSGGGRRRR